eukprot:TRINITY_DN8189_c0_g1_i2.p2 TRINITY_DN8189_c0_g1~~TRINITY_DN8189_c0_g1_i2.p2  ORF type:complete len:115 (+),score=6.82 TRINITY_DN8189_c0_g1_i2:181-525(+)
MRTLGAAAAAAGAVIHRTKEMREVDLAPVVNGVAAKWLLVYRSMMMRSSVAFRAYRNFFASDVLGTVKNIDFCGCGGLTTSVTPSGKVTSVVVVVVVVGFRRSTISFVVEKTPP